jgi:DNA modification methylase
LLPGFDVTSRLCGAATLLAAHRLPTNTTTRSHPIHRWFNFIAGFSPEFVMQCCTNARLTDRDHLLDPFSGCGTAPLVACQLGMSASGFEAHPVFARIGRAKLPSPSARRDVVAIRDAILRGLGTPVDAEVLAEAPRRFLAKLFDVEVLRSLLGARAALGEQGFAASDAAFMVLSRIVDKSTHSQTDGIYKAPTTKRNAQLPSSACDDTVQMILDDLIALGNPDYASPSRIFEHSSESMAEIDTGSMSIVVTSPPYLNNFDYAEMTRMLLYFWGLADSWSEITDRVRRHLIVNTTTALQGHKGRQAEYRDQLPWSVRPELDALAADLKHRRADHAGNKEYDFLVYPYFAQMFSVLTECKRCLRPGGQMHIMVADAALYGVHISTPQILAELLRSLGFVDVACELVRHRGHRWILAKREGSARGLGEYHVAAHRK